MGSERMSRAIKFRVWDIQRRQMFAVENMIFTQHGNICVTIHLENPSRNGSLFVGKDAELMQFAGLTDKNGRDIYEGDILGTPGEPRTYFQIVWDDTNGAWSRQGFWGDRALLSEDPIGSNEIVIGNVYENPHLLKKDGEQ